MFTNLLLTFCFKLMFVLCSLDANATTLPTVSTVALETTHSVVTVTSSTGTGSPDSFTTSSLNSGSEESDSTWNNLYLIPILLLPLLVAVVVAIAIVRQAPSTRPDRPPYVEMGRTYEYDHGRKVRTVSPHNADNVLAVHPGHTYMYRREPQPLSQRYMYPLPEQARQAPYYDPRPPSRGYMYPLPEQAGQAPYYDPYGLQPSRLG